jgi:D-arabinose 1-dehydrogenase-like Zn-dependent alcohol dehydrogenase
MCAGITTYNALRNSGARVGDVATQEAIFDVGGGSTLIEKYCDTCAKKIK